ncbi:hypothetical protein D3C80_1703790 [compost metagenome]
MEKVEHLNLEYPSGCIIGKVTIMDSTKINEELFHRINKDSRVYGSKQNYEGYVWHLKDPVIFEKTIVMNGKLGLWNYEL